MNRKQNIKEKQQEQFFMDEMKQKYHAEMMPIIERELSGYPGLNATTTEAAFSILMQEIYIFNYCIEKEKYPWLPKRLNRAIDLTRIPNMKALLKAFIFTLVQLDLDMPHKPFIFYTGSPGTGKSISAALCYQLDMGEAASPQFPFYLHEEYAFPLDFKNANFKNFFTSGEGLRTAYNSEAKDLTDMTKDFAKYEILVVDDLNETKFTEKFYGFFKETLLDQRNRNDATTVFTMNESIEDFLARITKEGVLKENAASIYRRISEDGFVVDFDNHS